MRHPYDAPCLGNYPLSQGLIRSQQTGGDKLEWNGYDGASLIKGLNYFRLSDILTLAGLNYTAIATTGCDVEVNFDFNCDWDKGGPGVPT